MNSDAWTILCHDRIFHRMNFALASDKSRNIIVAGGNDYISGDGLTSVITFDMEKKTINALPDLPEVSWTCTGAILKGYFYVADHNGSLYRLDLSTCAGWEAVKHSAGDLFGQTIVSDGNYLYSLGGRNLDRVLNSPCKKFDPDTQEWSDLPQMHVPRYRHTAVVVGNEIYIIGGNLQNQSKISSVEAFHIPSQTWRKIQDIPNVQNEHSDSGFCVSCASAAVYEGLIVLTGGRKGKRQNGIESSYCFIFNTYTQKWTHSNVCLPSARSAHGSTFIGGSKFVSIGGTTSDSVSIVDRSKLFPNWSIIQHFILIRKLLEDERAFLKARNEIAGTPDEKCVDLLLTMLNIETFRYVLSFLI